MKFYKGDRVEAFRSGLDWSPGTVLEVDSYRNRYRVDFDWEDVEWISASGRVRKEGSGRAEYAGVFREHDYWVATFKKPQGAQGNNSYTLGPYASREEAARAYDDYRAKLYGQSPQNDRGPRYFPEDT